MTTDIRQLTSADVGLMRELLCAFGKVFEQEGTYARAQPSDVYLQGLLGSDPFIALAAMENGSVVGGLAAYELRKFEQERSEVYIYDLAVVVRAIALSVSMRPGRDASAAMGCHDRQVVDIDLAALLLELPELVGCDTTDHAAVLQGS